ncbi:hypothetical protein SAMN05878443_0787 [Carnobacterium alterfunditum]|uniref:Uncharacterized protein n=1 Tax=Carnobacterium alterfunditum TaxID=28230 RepID=A0A1N6FRW2_9LACT|nr:hypothetical protein [Carnobacterium alterfunditum]SIN97990.1 hypothetical protein SAMN05878443_0787 [Carnobacterium alterfunditum]
MNKTANEKDEIIQELAGQTNEIVTALRKETLDLQNVCADLTNFMNDATESLSDDSYQILDDLTEEVIRILNVLEEKPTYPFDNYFSLLEKIDDTPLEELEA